MKDHFAQFAAYNRWVTGLLYDAAAGLDEGQLSRDVGVFFGSLAGTLNHIITTDHIWLARLTGEGDYPNRLDHIHSDDLAVLREMSLVNADRLVDHVDALSDADLDEPIEYATLNGIRHVQIRREALAHLFNHQTHHRSQAHTCLTLLGQEPPQLDLLYYQRLHAA